MMVAWSMRCRSSTATPKSRGYAGFPRHAGAGSGAVRLSGRGRDPPPVPRSVPVGLEATGGCRARSGSGFGFGPCAFCLTRICHVLSPPNWRTRGQHRAGRRLVGDDERGVASACPGEFRCPVEYGPRSSAPAESEYPSTAHRGHSSAVEPHGSSEAACGQHSEHSGIVAARTVARGRLTRCRLSPATFIEPVGRSSAAAPGPVRGSWRAVRSSPLRGVAHAWRRGWRPGQNSRLPPHGRLACRSYGRFAPREGSASGRVSGRGARVRHGLPRRLRR